MQQGVQELEDEEEEAGAEAEADHQDLQVPNHLTLQLLGS